VTKPYELPDTWEWGVLEDFKAQEKYSMTDGPYGSNLKSEDYVPSGTRVIRLGNIGVGEFVDRDQSFVSDGKYQSLLTRVRQS
jgi:type I restriction enzyme S subunit